MDSVNVSIIDEFAAAINAPRDTRIVDELVPEIFKKFYDDTIRHRMKVHKEGNVFPIHQYRHFE